MIKKTLTYVNYDDEKVTEEAYFNLSRAEIIKMDAVLPGGFEAYAQGVMARKNSKEMIQFMDMLILSSYGIRDMEGQFIKPKNACEAFAASEAYSALLEDLLSADGKIEEFVKGIMPKAPQDHKAPSSKPGKAPSFVDIKSVEIKEEKTESEEERINRLVQERMAQLNAKTDVES